MKLLALPTMAVFVCVCHIEFSQPSAAQEAAATPPETTVADAKDGDADSLKPAQKVDIEPLAEDAQIQTRLADILVATTWFEDSRVAVDEGVVTLTGITQLEQNKKWAGDLARNTQDVVAVINRIHVVERSVWDLSPAWEEVHRLGRETIQMLPLLVLAVVLMTIAWIFSGWAIVLSRRIFLRRMDNPLLVNVLSRTIAIPVFLIGLYLALRVSGLTQIAATVIGGTGLLGLIIGIAFRDIAENFLASILISIQRPFKLGDQIRVENNEGIVQSVTARGTLLMTLDGNYVQIPNSSIYKSVIVNVTANPNTRGDFLVGIGYDDSITEAQKVVGNILKEHGAVFETPDPLVLVEELGASVVKIRVYFWINSHEHSMLKVKSSVIRLTKAAIQEAGLSMPDEAREVFPDGVPVVLKRERAHQTSDTAIRPATQTPVAQQEAAQANDAENDLTSDRDVINAQARQSRSPEEGANLLQD